jgi:hypothetical protein
MLLRVTVAGGVLKALQAPTSSATATTRFVIITTRRQSTDDSLERCVLVCWCAMGRLREQNTATQQEPEQIELFVTSVAGAYA